MDDCEIARRTKAEDAIKLLERKEKQELDSVRKAQFESERLQSTTTNESAKLSYAQKRKALQDEFQRTSTTSLAMAPTSAAQPGPGVRVQARYNSFSAILSCWRSIETEQ